MERCAGKGGPEVGLIKKTRVSRSEHGRSEKWLRVSTTVSTFECTTVLYSTERRMLGCR